MARVPNISSPWGQVAGIAAGSLRQVSAIQKQNQQEEENRRIREIDTQYSLDQQELLFGADGLGGLYSLRGKSAVDAMPQFMAQMEELRNKTLEDAAGMGEDALQVLGASFNRRDLSARSKAYQKVGEAKTEYDEQITNSRIAIAVNNATLSPGSLNDSHMEITAEMQQWAAKRGMDMSNPIAQLQMMKARGALVENGVQQAIQAGDFERAASIMDRAGPEGDLTVEASVMAQLTKQFQGRIVDAKASELVDQAVARFGEDQKGALAWIKEQSEGVEEDSATEKYMKEIRQEGYIDSRAEAIYRHRRQLEKHAERQAQKSTVLRFQTSILSGEVTTWQQFTEQFPEEVLGLSFAQQNGIIKFIDNLNGGLDEPTELGLSIYNNLMTDSKARDSVTPAILMKLGEQLPQPMINSIISTIQHDQNSDIRLTRSRIDTRFRATMDSMGLGGERYREERGALTNDFYHKLEARGIDPNDDAAVDVLFKEVFDATRVGALIRKQQSSEKASTTTTQRLNAIYKAREIEDTQQQGTLDIMFREIIDKQYGGNPTAAQLDNAEAALLDNKIEVSGWFFGLGIDKNIVEIYQGMSQEEVNKTRSALVSLGNASPSRAQIAFFFAQQE